MSVVALDGGVVWLCRRLLLLIITSTLDIATDDQLVGWIWRNEGVKLENTTFMKLQITYWRVREEIGEAFPLSNKWQW